MPGAAISVHTFGDFQQFNPHLHLIATDGCFSGGGTFTKCPGFVPNDLEGLYRYEVLKMLKAEGKINDAVIENMLSWHHSGFNVYCGPTIWPNNDQGLEDLARYTLLLHDIAGIGSTPLILALLRWTPIGPTGLFGDSGKNTQSAPVFSLSCPECMNN